MIKIINFPFCNYSSVARMLKKFNYSFSNFQSDCHLLPEDVLILPGVGCFSEGMAYLKPESLVEEIKNHANSVEKLLLSAWVCSCFFIVVLKVLALQD